MQRVSPGFAWDAVRGKASFPRFGAEERWLLDNGRLPGHDGELFDWPGVNHKLLICKAF